jgi:hypothetical protein
MGHATLRHGETGMEQLPNCLLLVTVEVDAQVEVDWGRWYDEVHLPAALACPGVLRGRRYASVGDIAETDRGKRARHARTIYTTVYELAGPWAAETPEFQAMRGWYEFAPDVRSRTQVVRALS